MAAQRPAVGRVRSVAVIAGLAWAGVSSASAQEIADALHLGGYYLNVATGSLEGPFTPSGASDFQRLRIMAAPDLGPLRTDIAYEHALELVSDPDLGLTPSLGASSTGTEWLPLQWTITDGRHGAWRHRFDRLLVTAPLGGSAEVTAGRQTISWATTLVFTPADPFAPFGPADPFREYRGGVDAFRVQGFGGPFTELEFVLRPADTPGGTTITALGRASTAAGSWELSGWAGVLHDEVAASAAATVTAAGAAFRGEAELRWPDPVLRFALGADRSFPVAGRDLYVGLEYQRDGLGAGDPETYVRVLLSEPFRRGEMQVIGRDEAALQASWQVTPLLTADLLALWNLGDASFLLAPSASYSLSSEVSARGGLFVGLGSDRRAVAPPLSGSAASGLALPASEYGPVPTSLYLSLTAFF